MVTPRVVEITPAAASRGRSAASSDSIKAPVSQRQQVIESLLRFPSSRAAKGKR
jgi:hypothetical protein